MKTKKSIVKVLRIQTPLLVGVAFVSIIILLMGAVPVWAATFTVTNTDDSGVGSLRQAILDSNANSGVDVIEFNIGAGGEQTIQPNSALPGITEAIIDGTTQPGYAGTPIIELDGSNTGGLYPVGLKIDGGSSMVRGLVINRFGGWGIAVFGSNGDNLIQGNYVGVDVTGTFALGNRGGVFLGSPSNIIGTNGDGVNDTGEGNLISGNLFSGVQIQASQNVVAGNFIGTDVTGTIALGNDDNGVYITSDLGDSNRIGTNGDGTADEAERNIISANGGDGVVLRAGADQNVVAGNYIGTDVTGSMALGNVRYGVWIHANNFTAQSNRIGSDGDEVGDLAERNVISGNGFHGVSIGGLNASQNLVAGNFIGTDVTGTIALGNTLGGVSIAGGAFSNQIGQPDLGNTIAFNGLHGVVIVHDYTPGNTIQGNSIHSNADLGIELVAFGVGVDGVTPNDLGDVDTGPNDLQNFPVLTSVTTGGVSGTLNSAPNTTFQLEFFANSSCDPSGFGEGETFLGATTVTTDGVGDASFTASFPVPLGHFVTATATDPTGNTSEFAACVEALLGDACDNWSESGGCLTLLDHNGEGLEGGTAKFACGGSWQPPVPGMTDEYGILRFEVSCSNLSKVVMKFNQGSVQQTTAELNASNATWQTVEATIKLVDSNSNGIEGGKVDQGGGTWVHHGFTDENGEFKLEMFGGKSYKFRMTYNYGSNQITQDVASPFVFQTGAVYSDSSTATKYARGSWRTFVQGIELLPGSWHFRFNDGTPITYYTIEEGVENYIH